MPKSKLHLDLALSNSEQLTQALAAGRVVGTRAELYTRIIKLALTHLQQRRNTQTSDEAMHDTMQHFFKAYHALTAHSNLNYKAFAHSPINQACVQIVADIAFEDETRAEILNPKQDLTEKDIEYFDNMAQGKIRPRLILLYPEQEYDAQLEANISPYEYVLENHRLPECPNVAGQSK
ncbi:MAG TPA: hypothetical protein VI522_03190 [Gammaproteobacteria bacterium]|nr:hypothetical protein [Gammaproteobacteria bacterium]